VLSRRVGPFPVWAWAAIALAAFLIFSKRNRSGYFPLSYSFDADAGGVSIGARIATAFGRGGSDELTSEEMGELGASSGGLSVFGERETQPDPITAGGPDGTGGSGGGNLFVGGGNDITPIAYGTGPSSPKPKPLTLPGGKVIIPKGK